MVDVKLGDWDALGQAASAIRSAVFVDEQKILTTLEWDAADAGCVHALASNRFGLALTTGRLMPALEGVSKIGRMAVLASMRGSSIGRAVLDALVLAARHRGDKQLLLHAQASAVGFYSRAGFVAPGPVFSEAGITHQAMARMLRGVRLRLRSWLRSRLPSRQRSRLPPTPQSNVSNHSSWRG